MKKITLLLFLVFGISNSFAQNSCAGATAIVAGTYVVDAVNGAAITTTCSGTGLGTAAEWYAYTPTQSNSVTVTTDLQINICKDTRFHVYTGTCGNLTCLSGDDDNGVITCNSGNTNSFLSTATFNAAAGTTYYIAFDNKYQSTGFSFQLIQGAVIVPVPTPVSYTTQTISTVNSTYNYCVVDMNNDKKDDIVGISANNLRIHYQSTPNAFTVSDFAITGVSKMPYWSIAAGDSNKDGFNDLVLGANDGLSVWRSNSTGTAYSNFTPGNYIFCQRTNFTDLNNDGNLDVFSCHDIAPNVYYLNDSAGNLTYYQSTVTPGAMSIGAIGGNYATLWTDFDNDGDSDVFISKCSGPACELHRNDGNGVYTDISVAAQIDITPIQTWSSAIADFDNDGDMDIIITASAGTHKFFRNNLSNGNFGAFTNITAGSGWDTNTSTNIDNVAYDFDNNGFVDVLGGGGKIMFNQGNGTFAPVNYSGLSVGQIGDLNNDGFLDIMNGSTVRYAVPNTNKWLKVALNGIQSNGNGIGARVEIYGTWGKQIRDIRSGEGFRYMSSLNAHFGIGQATAIQQVIIRWPSGIVDTILNPTPNQTLTVNEGATLGLSENNSNQFALYPNPVSDIINIQLREMQELTDAKIYDINGRMVSNPKIKDNKMNVESLTTGIYILILQDISGNKFSQKFIKQ
jgi:hypothetical protein